MSLGLMTLIGLVVLAVLVVVYLRLRQQDLLGAIMKKRQASSKLVSRAEYVEGIERMPVALALSNECFYYENSDLEASFDLDRIDEVEYDSELATGKHIDPTHRVLRLRSHGAAFEFILENADASKWMAALPPRTYGGTTARAV